MERKNEVQIGEDKVWVSCSQTISVAPYEVFKIEMGLSKTITPGKDPYQLIDTVYARLRDKLSEQEEIIRDEFKK